MAQNYMLASTSDALCNLPNKLASASDMQSKRASSDSTPV
jgi:hypothetical protein